MNFMLPRFFWKLYAGYLALILISSLVIGIMVSQTLEREALGQVRESLTSQAIWLEKLVTLSIKSDTAPKLQEHIRAVGSRTGALITVIQANGVIVADSHQDLATTEIHNNRPEFLAARTQKYGFATDYRSVAGARVLHLAREIRNQNQLVGYIRISRSLASVDSQLASLQTAVGVGSLVSAILAGLLGFFLARHFMTPLRAMATVAEAISHGDYDKRLSTIKKDEIGELAQALNRVAESSRERTQIIRADRNKLSAILSGMAEGVVAVSHDERVVHLNEAAGKLLGTSPKRSVDRPIWQITRVREVSEILSETLRDDIDTQKSLKIAGEPSDQFIEIHASPLHDGQGHLVGAVAVLHDLTELQRLDMVRREFVANASHELKTPITAIRGLVETLIDDGALSALTRERFLGKIKDQAMRLSSIVVDLLALSRLESKGAEIQAALFDLREIVQAAVKNFAPIGEGRGIVVEAEVQGMPVELVADEDAIGQMVSNLLDNALKYTPHGGQVVARLSAQDDEAIIEIEDTGIGIEPKDKDRIFERFYRVDKARSKELGGTGLGLAIVKHIAFVHGGRVAVDSIPGSGSTFKVFLPLRQ